MKDEGGREDAVFGEMSSRYLIECLESIFRWKTSKLHSTLEVEFEACPDASKGLRREAGLALLNLSIQWADLVTLKDVSVEFIVRLGVKEQSCALKALPPAISFTSDTGSILFYTDYARPIKEEICH